MALRVLAQPLCGRGSGSPYRAICRCDNDDARLPLCFPPLLRLVPLPRLPQVLRPLLGYDRDVCDATPPPPSGNGSLPCLRCEGSGDEDAGKRRAPGPPRAESKTLLTLREDELALSRWAGGLWDKHARSRQTTKRKKKKKGQRGQCSR